MSASTGFYRQSIPVIFFLVLSFLLATALLSRLLGEKIKNRYYPEKNQLSDFLATTLLSLLALLLSFNLSMAVGRFEGRRHLAVEEANAVGTAFLRTRLVEPAYGDAIANFMKQYVDSRIDYYDADWGSKRAEAAKTLTKTFQKKIWGQATLLTHANRGAIENGLITTLNTMFDAENSRTIAHEKTLPEAVYWVILFIATMGIGNYSFNSGFRGEQNLLHLIGLSLTVVVLFVLIQDVDRPHGGLVRISQDAMVALRQSMN